MRRALALLAMAAVSMLFASAPLLALNPSLAVSQYAHTAWTVRDGFSLGNVYAMAQTPDGYLWLGTEFGLFRFDGVRFLPWQPPAGQQLPDKNINSLLVTRDGSLWIGTFGGLVILRDGRLARPPALHDQFVTSMFEDGEGTVWAASLNRAGLLCAIPKRRREVLWGGWRVRQGRVGDVRGRLRDALGRRRIRCVETEAGASPALWNTD